MDTPNARQIPPENTPAGTSVQTDLLALCEEFLRTASTTVHNELRQFLGAKGYHPITSHSWFMDSLALTTHNPHERE